MLRRLSALALFLVVSGCDSAGIQAQQAFEAQAFGSASDGVTPDDWRVAPFFAVDVQVTQAAAPNPATPSEQVSVQVYADETAGGLPLYRRELDGSIVPGSSFRALPPVAGPNIYTFTFSGGEASPTGGPGNTRLIVLDGLDRVVTYGDLVLR